MTRIPPFNCICVECINRTGLPEDPGGRLFYCHHNEVMAIKFPSRPGWHIHTELKPAEFLALVDSAQNDLALALANFSGGSVN